MNGILIFYLKCGQVKNTALITYAFDKTFPTDEFIFSALTNIYILYLKVKKNQLFFLLFLKNCGDVFFFFQCLINEKGLQKNMKCYKLLSLSIIL